MKKTVVYIILVIILILLAGLIFLQIKRPQISASFNKQGVSIFYEGKTDEAISSFEKAIKWNKSWIVPYINLAQVYYSKNDYEKALEFIENITSVTDTINIVKELSGKIALKQNSYQEAIDILSNLIAKDSLNPKAFYYRGIGYANLNNYEAAIEDYQKSKSISANTDIIRLEELIVLTLEDFGSGVSGYDSDVESDRNFTDAFYERGYFKLNIDDLDGALSDLDRAIDINQKYAKAYYYKGLVLARKNELEKAIENFEMSRKLNYKEYNSMYNIGFAYFKQKNYKTARNTFKSMLTKYPSGEKNAETYKLTGTIDMIQGNYASAIKNYNKSLEINLNNADSYFNRAIAYGSIKEHQKAIEDLNKCLSLGMKTSDVYYSRGVQYINLNEFEKGCKDIKKAASQDHPEASKMLDTYCKNY